MRDAQEEYVRQLLREAFRAGWQAALAVQITNPRVFEVVDSCCELWLAEAGDEVELFGFTFRGREDLPLSALPPTSPLAQPPRPVPRPVPRPAPLPAPAIPAQPAAADAADAAEGRPGHRRGRRLFPGHAT